MQAERKLFIVRKGQPSQPAEPEDTEPEICQLSGNTRLDAARALSALAFLIDFLSVTGTDEIRKCAAVLTKDQP